jgi:hypothetical protein
MRFALLILLVPAAALAGERVIQFRSVEDPAVIADPTVCPQAGFVANVRLAASLWTTRTRAVDGREVQENVKKIGTATACVRLTHFTFPAGLQQEFYVKFELPDGAWTAKGTCTLTSNNVPKTGLVLAGCALNIVSAPSGVVGGVATSASVFNPFKLTGFGTGSHWTLHAYDTSTGEHDHESHASHHDMEDLDDGD